jgi:hypothetical protein
LGSNLLGSGFLLNYGDVMTEVTSDIGNAQTHPRNRRGLAIFCAMCAGFTFAATCYGWNLRSERTHSGLNVRFLEDQKGKLLWVTNNSAEVKKVFPNIRDAARAVANGYFRNGGMDSTISVWIPTHNEEIQTKSVARYWVYQVQARATGDAHILSRSISEALPNRRVLVELSKTPGGSAHLIPRGDRDDVYLEFDQPSEMAERYAADYFKLNWQIRRAVVSVIHDFDTYDRFYLNRELAGRVSVTPVGRDHDPFGLHVFRRSIYLPIGNEE